MTDSPKFARHALPPIILGFKCSFSHYAPPPGAAGPTTNVEKNKQHTLLITLRTPSVPSGRRRRQEGSPTALPKNFTQPPVVTIIPKPHGWEQKLQAQGACSVNVHKASPGGCGKATLLGDSSHTFGKLQDARSRSRHTSSTHVANSPLTPRHVIAGTIRNCPG